jgi:hypothetical protein
MLERTTVEKARREGLKVKRDSLFAEYPKSPSNTRLAVEIKLIDDDIAAKSVEQTERQRRRQ